MNHQPTWNGSRHHPKYPPIGPTTHPNGVPQPKTVIPAIKNGWRTHPTPPWKTLHNRLSFTTTYSIMLGRTSSHWHIPSPRVRHVLVGRLTNIVMCRTMKKWRRRIYETITTSMECSMSRMRPCCHLVFHCHLLVSRHERDYSLLRYWEILWIGWLLGYENSTR